MDILAILAVAAVFILVGFGLNNLIRKRYGYAMFNGKAIGLMALAAVSAFLAFVFYEPGTAENQAIEILAGAFIIGLVIIPLLVVLVEDIRKTNILWAPFVFGYQLLVTCTVGILLILVWAKLNED
jgi:hypothetical protein